MFSCNSFCNILLTVSLVILKSDGVNERYLTVYMYPLCFQIHIA